MEVEILQDYIYANNYIVGNNDECIIIDPSSDVRNIKKFVNGRNVLGVFLTHGHFDHFVNLENVLKEYPTKVYLHKKAYDKLLNPELSCASMFGYLKKTNITPEQVVFLNDGETLALGNLKIKIFFTPGHTNCSISYLIDNFLFSGDTLFKESVGRTDLPTGSNIELTNSLKKLLNFKVDYIVYPGHDDTTSINYEVKYNPYYQRIK